MATKPVKHWAILLLSIMLHSLLVQFANSHLVPMAARTPLPGTPSPPGSLWPWPVWIKTELLLATLNSVQNFDYSASVSNCTILNEAFDRYNYALLTHSSYPTPAPGLPILSTVYVEIPNDPQENLCLEYPKLNKDLTYESYNLSVGLGPDENTAIARIKATTIWGALHGLETFSQLIWRDLDWSVEKYYINFTEVVDYPRYPHRGLMLDTARHYLPPKAIEEVLDAMSYIKLNVFHWHLTDDQSFPYVSQKFPELSEKGAFIPGVMIYDPPTVQSVIQLARARGIRVVLEFDTPGHTLAFGNSHRELLTPCYGDGVTPGTPDYPNFAPYENLDPTKETTYTFMREFFTEVFQNVSKDEYMHLGMDEIYYPCWLSSPEIKAFMDSHQYTTINQVQEYYSVRHLDMIKSLNAKAIIWQDPLEFNVDVDKDVLIQVWKDTPRGHPYPWQKYLQDALDGGYKVLLSACWYVNYLKYGQTWREYYDCDPVTKLPNITESQKELIYGGEAAIWSEYADSTNVIPRLFPYIGAVAEKLWSPIGASSVDDALYRLDEHRCRMLGRGIQAQPLITSYCFPEEISFSYERPTISKS